MQLNILPGNSQGNILPGNLNKIELYFLTTAIQSLLLFISVPDEAFSNPVAPANEALPEESRYAAILFH